MGTVAKKKVMLNLNLQKGSFVNPNVSSDGKERNLEREEGEDMMGKLQRERLGKNNRVENECEKVQKAGEDVCKSINYVIILTEPIFIAINS